jgi:hypothetical protein
LLGDGLGGVKKIEILWADEGWKFQGFRIKNFKIPGASIPTK